MADQIHYWWHMPYSEMVGWIDACCGEFPTHVHIAATDTYGSDTWVRTKHTATEGRPTAPVPLGYTACRHPICFGEVSTRVHIAATGSQSPDIIVIVSQTAAEARPCAAIPLGYAVYRHPTCDREAPTRVYVGATDGYFIDVAIPANVDRTSTRLN